MPISECYSARLNPSSVAPLAIPAEVELQALIESNVIGVVRLTRNGFLSANGYFCRMIGYEEAELTDPSVSLYSIVDPKFRER